MSTSKVNHRDATRSPFTFTLILDGHDVLSPATLDALFEAGCDDATFGAVDGIAFADFTRSSGSASRAIASAIRDVESVPGVRATRVEPDDLVTASEIAERLGRSRESVRLWIEGARGPGGFPPPASHLRARTRLWRWADVSRWLDTMAVDAPSDPEADFIAALNEALGLRGLYPKLKKTQRSEIDRLLVDV